MEGYGFVHRERVRFADVDAMGHMNNAVYLTFCEQARLAFFASIGLPAQIDMILARAEVDFRAEVHVGDEVEIGVRPLRLGTKSFELEHELRVEGRLVAQARSVLVAYDYATRQSVPLPDDWRRALSA